MNIINRFSKHLTAIEYPKTKTSWNIAGIIKNKNAFYKFDVRDMFELQDGTFAQTGQTNTKADKMVLELQDKWIIVDLEELHKYIKKYKLNKINTETIIKTLEWNILLNI